MLYEENLHRWSLFCPLAAEQIKLLSDNDRLKIIETNSLPVNLQMTIDGKDYLFHDPKDPQEEAKALVKAVDFEMCEILYVYGVGFGYIFDELKEWLQDPKHTLVFLEDHLAVIDAFLHTPRAKEILEHPRVWLYYLNNILKDFDDFVKMFVIQRPKVVGLPLYQQLYARKLNELGVQISFMRNIHSAHATEFKNFGRGFFTNYFNNLFAWPKGYLGDGLFKRFNSIPAIICGAGPSLSKNLDLLGTLTDRAIIFAGGTAMNAVNAKGLIPHFGVGIDPNFEQSTRIIMNKAFDTPFLYRSRINYEALRMVSGDLLYLGGNSGYVVADYFDKNIGIEPTDLEEGCNVINFSLSIAEKMGCNPIILVGVDLSYSNDQSYAPGVINHPIHPGKKLFRTKEHTEELLNYTDINGKPVFTLWKWITESLWFTQFAKKHPGITMINATEGGIGFTGIPNLTLKDAAEKYLNKQYDLNAHIFGEVQDHPMPAMATFEYLSEVIQTFSKSLEKSLSLLQEKIKRTLKESGSESLEPLPQLKENVENISPESDPDSLYEEIAYRFFLCKFEEAYNNLHQSEHLRLDIDADLYPPAEMVCRRLDFKVQLYTHLCKTAILNVQLINWILKNQTAQKQNLADTESPSPWRQKAQSIHDEHSAYSFEEGKLTLIDPEFDLHYQEAFIPNEEDKYRLVDEEGRLKHEYFFRDGKLHGPSKFYSAEGRLLVQNWYIDGQLQGKSFQYFSSGELYGIQRFHNGVKHGKQERFYKNGTQRSISSFKEGLLDGEVLLIHENGLQARSLNFVEGQRNGIEQFWNNKGLLIIKAEFKDGLPSGTASFWYDNGTLGQEASYADGGELLSLKRWAPNGVEIKEEQWKRLDYFEGIAHQAGILTDSISGIFDQASAVAQIVAEKGKSEKKNLNMENLTEEFAALKKELEKLQSIQKELLYESGLDGKNPHEAIWKTPSIQREFQQKLDAMTKQLQEGVSKLQASFSHTVEELKSRQDKKDEHDKGQPPPPPKQDA